MMISIRSNFALALAGRARALLCIGVAAICPQEVLTPLYAQTWTPGTAASMYYTAGNVGIGTTSPGYNLDVSGNIHTSNSLLVNDGVYSVKNTAGAYVLATCCGGTTAFYSGTRNWGLRNSTDTLWLMYVQNSGNVGIGTTAPQYLLSVNGTIGAKEVIVTNSGWADYVFDSSYHLMPLKELRAYVMEHHHLPDVPSEPEIKSKGVDLSEMTAKLLAKIEELTLHLIDADERADQLAKQNQDLQAQMRELFKKGTRLN